MILSQNHRIYRVVKKQKVMEQICKVCGQSKPVTEFWKNRFGVTHTCKECAKKKKAEVMKNLREKKRQSGLSDYSPRELLAELKRRGYRWKDMVVEIVQKIDYDKI